MSCSCCTLRKIKEDIPLIYTPALSEQTHDRTLLAQAHLSRDLYDNLNAKISIPE